MSIEATVQLELQRANDSKFYKRLSNRLDDYVGRLSNHESKRLRDQIRYEDSQRRRSTATWNRILEQVANERGPWGCGVEDQLHVLLRSFISFITFIDLRYFG